MAKKKIKKKRFERENCIFNQELFENCLLKNLKIKKSQDMLKSKKGQ